MTDAVTQADAVITATTTTTGYIGYDLLAPGTTVINVSLDDLCEDVYFKAGLLVVDDWHLVKTDNRRLLGRMVRAGSIAGPSDQTKAIRKVDAEIGDIVTGRHPGRESDHQVIVVNPFGLAIEDIAFARAVYDIAIANHAGVRLRR